MKLLTNQCASEERMSSNLKKTLECSRRQCATPIKLTFNSRQSEEKPQKIQGLTSTVKRKIKRKINEMTRRFRNCIGMSKS